MTRRRSMFSVLSVRAAGLVRLATYVSIVGLGLGAWGLRAAKAEAGRAGLGLGRQLLPLIELETERSTLRINGQQLSVSSATVDGTLETVLDRFEHACEASVGTSAGPRRSPWPQAARAGPSKHAWVSPLDVFRREGKDEGVIFCFVRRSGNAGSLADAVARYRESGDLGALGALRYAYVSKSDATHVRVVATWTEGSFKLDARLPSGDAEGTDPELAPRPPGSTRLFSATLGEAPFGMYTFTSAQSPAAVVEFYAAHLQKAQYVMLRPPGEEAGRIWVRDDVQVILSATRDGERTLVSIGELGAQTAQR